MNETTSLIKSYKGKTIRVNPITKYVCLTDMATASGKQLNDWVRLNKANCYLETLSAITGIPVMELLYVPGGNTGTWAHPKVAIRFAQWCSDEFAVQVDFWIDELLTTGKVEIVQQRQLPPVRDIIDYAHIAIAMGIQDDPILKSLISQRLAEQLSPGVRAINAPEQPLNVTSIASNLGFSQQSIGNGSGLGKYIAARHAPLGTSQHGKYQVNVYLPSEVESTVQAFFATTLVLAN